MTARNSSLHPWFAPLLVSGLATAATGQDVASLSHFARYTEHDPVVPVYVMPGDRLLHRFFDTSPVSPSGRYLAAFRLPYEGRSPEPGEAGDVVVIDLRTGQERVVAQSHGWEVQLGANVQWGRTDAELYFNDVDPEGWRAFAVQLDPATGKRRELGGTVFMASPDGATLLSHNLVKSRRAQVGYGVVVPADRVGRNVGPVADDGLYVTDVATGRCRMLVSLGDIYGKATPSIRIPDPERFEYYGFQAKWNPQGTRILTTVQWTPRSGGPRRRAVITMGRDGGDIRTAVTADRWARGGHHVNWCPDGEHLTMNLDVDDDPDLELVRFRYDGGDLRVVFEPGSGHPSVHPGGRFIVTDAYPGEKVAFGDGSVPIRLIDTRKGTSTDIVRMFISAANGEFRVDPHPAWGAGGRLVVFNGFAGGTRRVYVADVGGMIVP